MHTHLLQRPCAGGLLADHQWLCASVLVLHLASSCALAQQTSAELDAWFDQSVKNAQQDMQGRALKLSWRVADLSVPAQDDIDRMRREVPGHPDHPDRTLLAVTEQKLVGHFPAVRRTAWILEDGLRINTDNVAGSAEGFTDIVIGGDNSWAMTSRGLDIVDTERPDPGYDYRPVTAAYLEDAYRLMTMGFRDLRHGSIEWSMSQVSPTGWLREGRDREGRVWRVSGDWDAESNVARVTGVRAIEPAGSAAVDYECAYSQHRFEPVLGSWIAGRYEAGPASPRAVHIRCEFETAESLQGVDTAGILRVPNAGVADAIRGKPSYSIVRDMRPGERLYTEHGSQGMVSLPIEELPREREHRWIRLTGWSMAGLLVAALVLFRMRRQGTA